MTEASGIRHQASGGVGGVQRRCGARRLRLSSTWFDLDFNGDRVHVEVTSPINASAADLRTLGEACIEMSEHMNDSASSAHSASKGSRP